MKRNKIIKTFSQDRIVELEQLTAYHEAGHAAGIYLNNKAKCLPTIPFKIVFKQTICSAEADSKTYQIPLNDCSAKVEGGRFIEILPPLIGGPLYELTEYEGSVMHWEKDFRSKLEADVINLLIGPLAEAKYVADKDDELFNEKLVNLNALYNYGGSSDISTASECLHYLSADKRHSDEILHDLFLEAFNFVNDNENWAAITKLAGYILYSRKNVICYEEVISTLDQAVVNFQQQMSFIAKHHYWRGFNEA